MSYPPENRETHPPAKPSKETHKSMQNQEFVPERGRGGCARGEGRDQRNWRGWGGPSQWTRTRVKAGFSFISTAISPLSIYRYGDWRGCELGKGPSPNSPWNCRQIRPLRFVRPQKHSTSTSLVLFYLHLHVSTPLFFAGIENHCQTHHAHSFLK